MAHVEGFAATVYAQIVQAPADDEEFELGAGSASQLPNVPKGHTSFSALTSGDTIAYRAISLEDPAKWEVGLATYDGTNDTLDRTDANVLASSNSNKRVDFKKSDGSGGGAVLVEGIAGLGALSAAYTITNWTADRAMDCDTAAAAEIADVLASLISDLAAAGIIKASVAAA